MLTWFLVVDGITLIVTQSKLTSPLRDALDARSEFFGFLLSCPMCFGFWVGVLLALLGLLPEGLPANWPTWAIAWASGAAASASAFSFHVVRKLLMQQLKPEVKKP